MDFPIKQVKITFTNKNNPETYSLNQQIGEENNV